jgi:hypothetical protein
VGLYRLFADVKNLGDLFIASSIGQVFQHLPFPLGKLRTRDRFCEFCREVTIALSRPT